MARGLIDYKVVGVGDFLSCRVKFLGRF